MKQREMKANGMTVDKVKVGFFEKVMAKFSNLSNRHTCEPKIVSELLFPVNIVTTI